MSHRLPLPPRSFVPIRPVLVVLFALIGLVALRPAPTHADEWCWNDPIVLIGCRTVSINVGVQGSSTDVRKSVWKAHIKITVPAGVPTQVVLVGTEPFDEDVTFVRTNASWHAGAPIPVSVSVTFEAIRNRSASVKITGPGVNHEESGGTRGRPLEWQFTIQ